MKDFMKEMEKEAEKYNRNIDSAKKELFMKVEIFTASSHTLFKLDGAKLLKGMSMLDDYVNGKFDSSILGPKKKKKRR